MKDLINEKLPNHLLKTDMCYRSFARGEYVGVIGCGFFLKSGVSRDHIDSKYSHYAAVYVLRGRGTFIDHTGKKYKITAGCLFQRNPAYKHTLLIDPDSNWAECFIGMKNTIIEDEVIRQSVLNSHEEEWKKEVLRMPNKTLDILEHLNIINPKTPVLYPGVRLEKVQRFDTILQRMKTANELQLLKLQLEILNLLSDLNSLEAIRRTSSYEEEIVEFACKRIMSDLCARTPFPELLQGIGISYSRLRSIFRKHMGVSPGTYKIQRRIDHACTLLATSTSSIQQIAAELGYNDQFAFSAQFKKVTGITPNKFRKDFIRPNFGNFTS